MLALRRHGTIALPTGDIVALRPYTLPAIGAIAPGSLVDRLLHPVVPMAVLVLLTVQVFSRFLRASMLDVLRQEYVRTVRANGHSERRAILRHAMRNAVIPLVTNGVLADQCDPDCAGHARSGPDVPRP